MSFAELEKILEEADASVKYCKICHLPFEPKRRSQILCGNPDCKQELRKQYNKEYQKNNADYKAKHRASNQAWRDKQRKKKYDLARYDELQAKWERMERFDKLIAEVGLHYGEYQMKKTLEMVEPIKLTLGDD